MGGFTGIPDSESEEQAMAAIFNYIDRIFTLVKPKKLLYISIDGFTWFFLFFF